ncbi:MAG: hypothetical protein ABS79_01755 [Planctomycetes bacterium SCN 63-9]|nr:MAG: hypothetical protein ABS79_01755 [Planctomycetes bacterium SCN 63-9]
MSDRSEIDVAMRLVAWLNAERATVLLLMTLLAAWLPLTRAWRAARGTALRPMLIWGGLAVGLATVAQVCGLVEPLGTGRPWMGRFTYLSALASLASLLSALNARTPGEGAWALLMAMLIVVFLIPWLEEPGRFRQAQELRILRLDAPWTIFFILVAGTGVTNYLPTRYGPAAILLGIGYALEYLGLTHAGLPPDARVAAWSGFSWCLALAIWIGYGRARARPVQAAGAAQALNRSWFWFRDHWGVVWGLRIAERFNKSAELSKWPCRLGWFGIAMIGEDHDSTKTDQAPIPEVAVSTFRGLLRRFAKPERLEEIGD